MSEDIPEGVKQIMGSLNEFSQQFEEHRKPKEKLVRDNMTELCNSTPGMTPMTYRVASEEEMYGLLMNKLYEEVGELGHLIFHERGKGTKTLHDLGEELADVKEVLEAIAVSAGLFPTDIEIIQNEKKAKKGAFKKRIVWDGNL
jgi:predicted house-cleaning noncanonical NTP pyrophosphatase (MazG superfamily)